MVSFFILSSFFDDAVTIGIEEILEFGNLGAELFAFVSIGYQHAVG